MGSIIGDWIQDYRLLVTVCVILLVWAVRSISTAGIRRKSVLLTEGRRRLIGRLKSLSGIMIALVVIALWLPQIQHFALSITAVALALVIATKEIILCLSGTVLKQLTTPFRIGDWIRIQDQFGEVIDESLLTTTLLEIDPSNYSYTGRTLMVPNSQFLSGTITNDNILKLYVFHHFHFTILPADFNIQIQLALVHELELICSEFAETAKRYNTMLERRSGIDIPNAEPSVSVQTNELANVVVTATLFFPIADFESISLKVTQAFYKVLERDRERQCPYEVRKSIPASRRRRFNGEKKIHDLAAAMNDKI